ncbi:MAG TPA: hypothetical protein ENI85_03055 [Deltaproteobacteria bacterium]|nr:hypothetical protein [Deltaproteobacteria bacterium]
MTRFPIPTALRGLLAVLGMTLLMSALGCANGEFRFGDPFDRQLTLSEAQHRYTVLVRWSEFKKARSFVAETDREAFMAQMKNLDDVRFTDYESEPVELDAGKQKATVRVTYTLYTPSIPYEIEISEVQEWTRKGIGNQWRVQSSFEGLRQLAAN